MLLYNKMELGDLNANFTLEVDSKVKRDSSLSEVAICLNPLVLTLFFFLFVCAFELEGI